MTLSALDQSLITNQMHTHNVKIPTNIIQAQKLRDHLEEVIKNIKSEQSLDMDSLTIANTSKLLDDMFQNSPEVRATKIAHAEQLLYLANEKLEAAWIGKFGFLFDEFRKPFQDTVSLWLELRALPYHENFANVTNQLCGLFELRARFASVGYTPLQMQSKPMELASRLFIFETELQFQLLWKRTGGGNKNASLEYLEGALSVARISLHWNSREDQMAIQAAVLDNKRKEQAEPRTRAKRPAGVL